MKLSANSIKICEGKVLLKKRSSSSAWQAHYKIGTLQIRLSTKETELEKAKSVATDLYLYARFREKDGKPAISKKFSAVAKLAIARMRDELDAGHGKRIFETYIGAIEKYLMPYYGNHNIDNIDFKLIKGFDAFRRTIQNQAVKASTQSKHSKHI